MKRNIIFYIIACAIVAAPLASCTQEIDNSKSRHQYALEVTASADNIVLNGETPDEDALTVTWTRAVDHGNDFIVTYEWSMDVLGGKSLGSGYDDYEEFSRTFTHKELQDLLVGKGDVPTSTNTGLVFEVEATFDGPYLVVPDAASVTVKVKTYGAKQFLAERLYLSGTAVGEKDIELVPKANNASLYVYDGPLGAGEFNFSAYYQDEHNAFAPAGGKDVDIDAEENAMDVAVVDFDGAASWKIAEAKNYRVSLNIDTRQVTVQDAANILEMDALYLAGSAVAEEINIAQTLENESLYAWKGELKAGALYIPVEFEGNRTIALVNSAESTDLTGAAVGFAQSLIAAAQTKAWTIPADGTYRIVVDIDAKTVRIYDAEHDLKPKMTGSWNGDAAGYGNPCEIAVECLWMYGTFESRLSGDSGLQVGFFNRYRCLPSLADPQVLVYSGNVLPLNTSNPFYPGKDGSKNAPGGSVMFYVGPETPFQNEATGKLAQPWNNSYGFGSTAEAVRGSYCGYVNTTLGVPAQLVEGQGNNRYAYFIIPANCNLVIVDIRNMQVTFSTK